MLNPFREVTSYAINTRRKKRNFNLKKLMQEFCEALGRYERLKVYFMVESCHKKLKEILNKYEKDTESISAEYKKLEGVAKNSNLSISKIRNLNTQLGRLRRTRDELRKEAAKKFWNIMENITAIVPKFLSVLPKEWESSMDSQKKWKTTAISAGWDKGVIGSIKNHKDLLVLTAMAEEILDAAAGIMKTFSSKSNLMALLKTNPKQPTAERPENTNIGSPVIIKGPRVDTKARAQSRAQTRAGSNRPSNKRGITLGAHRRLLHQTQTKT